MESRRPLGIALPTPADKVLSLAFSSDGGTLYAAGDHVPLQKYVITSSKVAVEVCRRAGAGLSPQDWRTYVPELPYRKVC